MSLTVTDVHYDPRELWIRNQLQRIKRRSEISFLYGISYMDGLAVGLVLVRGKPHRAYRVQTVTYTYYVTVPLTTKEYVTDIAINNILAVFVGQHCTYFTGRRGPNTPKLPYESKCYGHPQFDSCGLLSSTPSVVPGWSAYRNRQLVHWFIGWGNEFDAEDEE
jgi:hypothetical protein